VNTSPMRLVISGPLVGDKPTGPAVHLTELTRAMIEQHHDLSVVVRHSSARGADANRESAARIDARIRPITTPIPATVLRCLQADLRFPPERLLLGSFDIYHQFHTDADPAVPSSRLVVTLHDTVALNWPGAEGRMYKHAGRLLRRAAAVITVSEFSKSAISAAFGVDPTRIHVVYNGVDHDRFRQLDTGEQRDAVHAMLGFDEPYLLFVGGFTPRKNVPRIIDAFALARRASGVEPLRLVLVGPVGAMERDLRAQTSADLPQDALVFAGYVPDERMPLLYNGAEALVYPSLYEGFGMPVVEAMSCGTPVVTANGSSLTEVAGDAAVLVDPQNVQSIADGIVRVISERADERAYRVRLGVARANDFNWTVAARQLLSIYDHVSRRSA
jgi:glycosyltransferase involved in cell wall biosynthesis